MAEGSRAFALTSQDGRDRRCRFGEPSDIVAQHCKVLADDRLKPTNQQHIFGLVRFGTFIHLRLGACSPAWDWSKI